MRRSPNRRHNLSARSQSLFIKFMNATKSAKDRGLKQSQQGKRQQQRTSIIRNYYNQKSVVLCAFHLLYDYFLTVVVRLTGWNDLYWGSLCKWGVHLAKHVQFFSHFKIRHQFSSLTVGRQFFSKMTWNNREIVTNTWSYTFSWRPRCLVRRRPVLLRVSFLYLAGQSPFMIFHLVTSLKPKFALWRTPAFLGNWLNAILLEIIALKLET